MIEKLYNYSLTKEKTIERIVDDEHVNLNHVVLTAGDILPEHSSNSNVYLLIVSGTLTGRFGDQEEKEFPTGSIINVPYKTRMNMCNRQDPHLEFFIFKAPHPDQFEETTSEQ